ncbi:unnamed protein product [Peronospora destructor]|uniref:FYVE-type domain-containing protein n=1 Tax=Peronospora destructor TaxID=86335 RepID=A0AAV0U032_9STRA|nr:unnamed protein product [Peronospora destructor]
MELPLPLYSGFFPQMVLTVEELMHYRRVGKKRVFQLVRIIDDADCVYRWTDLKAHNGRCVQKAQFLDIQPVTKQLVSKEPSTILKCSIHIVDGQVEEILQAIAKVKTRDARRAMSYVHGDEVLDTQTLLTFPTSSDHKKPSYSYRAIKWSLLKAKQGEGHKMKNLDFCYLEYAGKSKIQDTASSVVGFCIQESIATDRQVPTLERYNILRGYLVRSGIVITKTHQSNILKVTAIAQIDGAMASIAVRLTMEKIMVDFVAAVHRVKGLLERQRMGRLQYLNEWDFVSTKDRKACAVCLRRFYFHRKHHCVTCGEVVCSNCAPLRELEEPLDKSTHCMRVCSVCMAQAGSRHDSNTVSRITESEEDRLETTTYKTNVGTDTYVEGLRYPKHREMQRESIDESLRKSSPQQTPVCSPTPLFRQQHHPLSGHAQRNDFDDEDARNTQYPREVFESARRERRSSVLRHLTLSSSTMSAQAKKETLSKLVKYARQIRDTINIAISEAEEEEERHSIFLESGQEDPDAGAERHDGIFDRIMKIRETLGVSSSDFHAVLESIGRNGTVCPSDAYSDRLDSGLAFSFSKETGSEDTSAIESDSIGFGSSRSSLLSASLHSLDHQDAGEPLPSPTPEQENAVEEARALEEAMQWVRQSESATTLRPPRPAPLVVMRTKVDDQTDSEPFAKSAPAPTPIIRVSKNRGIERLSHKIGRLHQRLEATQCKSEVTSSDPMSVVADPVTPTPLDVVAVIDKRDRNEDDEPEPEEQPTSYRSTAIPALQQSRGPATTDFRNEKHVEIENGEVLSSSSTARREPCPQRVRLSEPSRASSDLIAGLRGVMNSSELTHGPPRRRPVASPLETPPNSPSLASASSRKSFSWTSRRTLHPAAIPALPPFSSTRPTAMASSALTPAHGTTIYVFDYEDRLQKVQRRSLGCRPPKATEAMTARLDELAASNEDDKQEDSGTGICLFSTNEEQGQARSSTAAASLSPALALGTDRPVRVCDESGELRELMEGLAKAPLRQRCSSGQSSGAPPTEKFDL